MLPGWAIGKLSSACTYGGIFLNRALVVGALELQSKNVIAGSIRIFYALIYSLFLGFGVSIGTALYGAIDRNATSASNCPAGFLDGGDALSMVITYAMVFIFTIWYGYGKFTFSIINKVQSQLLESIYKKEGHLRHDNYCHGRLP